LLPCQSFVTEPFLRARALTNYWGYNSAAWFSPANEFAIENAVVEFKTMVKALHAAGLEVILDIVFNHTAEGNESGPVLNFKGLDNSVYYRLLADKRLYDNVTGTGNTVNCEHARVRELIVDCLKYWTEEMHVDGFRFDLATVLGRDAGGFNEHSDFFKAVRAEPALDRVKLIAEPWDVGWGGYQLGRFPAGWAEWNDRYRDTVRSFWRRDIGRIGELAERFAGSSDLFRNGARRLHAVRPGVLQRQAQPGERREQLRRNQQQPELELRCRRGHPRCRSHDLAHAADAKHAGNSGSIAGRTHAAGGR